MPTVLREGPYAFVFFSSDKGEPVHIHVKRNDLVAKFWLAPISLAINHGFKSHELRRIEKIIAKNEDTLVEAWHVYFNS